MGTLSLLQLALRTLSRRVLRTSLTLGGVALGVAAFVALVGFSSSFEKEWRKALQSSGTDIAVVQKTFLNTSVDAGVEDKLRAIPDVADVAPLVFNIMDLTPEVNTIVYGRPEKSFEMDSLTMTQGRKFRGEEPEIILGELLAESVGKKAGDTLEIQGTTFRITGIFLGSAIETGSAMLPIGQLQRLSDLGNKVTAFHVKLGHPRPGESVDEQMRRARANIDAALPGLRAVAARDRASNNQIVALARSSAWGTSIIALLIGAFGIANTMAISVFERTKDIGVFRALGWKRSRIMKLILTAILFT
jgi:putative ABC transport system permease protein